MSATLSTLLQRLYRLHRFGIRPGLDRITALLDRLGNPHHRYPSIHVTGTNGKGSVCAMTASILQAQGYRVGLYTSPHVCHFSERIRIGGIPASDEAIAEWLPPLLETAESLGATFFEVTTALAFQLFAEHGIDIAVVEVGMGGRYDATNVISSAVAVVTSIDYDHQQFLGSTLEEIAWQKIGIVKPDSAVVIGERDPRLRGLLTQWAYEAQARQVVIPQAVPKRLQALPTLEQLVFLPEIGELVLPLAGEHQAWNLAIVLSIRELLAPMFPVEGAALAEGLRHVRQWGGLRARIEPLRLSPPLVVDVAHNPGGISALLQALDLHGYSSTRWQLVFGAMADKDYESMLRLLAPHTSHLIACSPATERAVPAEQLATVASRCGFSSIEVIPSVAEAARRAWERECPTLIVGSFYVVGEALPVVERLCGCEQAA
ncbi:MAG: folylpolyglutamate synthase/dihydrofolate synthase family protein [Chlorobiota bacterium]